MNPRWPFLVLMAALGLCCCNPELSIVRGTRVHVVPMPIHDLPTLEELVDPIISEMNKYGLSESTSNILVDTDWQINSIELTISENKAGTYQVYFRTGRMFQKVPIERVFTHFLLIIQREWPRFEEGFFADIKRRSPVACDTLGKERMTVIVQSYLF